MADFYDPISDIQTEWDAIGGNHYGEIDDGVRNPSEPTLADYVSTSGNGAVDEWGFSTVAPTVELCAWVYVETGSNATIEISLQQGGVERASLVVPVNTPKGWWHCCWMTPTGDLSAMTIEATMIKSGGGAGTHGYVYAAYLRAGPQLDVQVGASGDDGYKYYATGFNNSATILNAGYGTLYAYHSFVRFIGVSIEGTIDVSYVEVYYNASSGSPELDVYGVDEDNPAAPTTYEEFDADAANLTSASVPWDAGWSGTWNQSPSLNSIFQELVGSYTISDDAVMLQIRDGKGSSTHINKCYSYDYNDHSFAPKLHIEYTVGGVDVTVDAVLATAAAAGLVAGVTGGAGATVSGELATAAAEGLVAVISGGTGTTVTAVLAETVAAALLPTIAGGATVSGELAAAVAEALIAVVTGEGGVDAQVDAVTATAIAAGLIPAATGGSIVSAILAEAAASGLVPTITAGAIVSGVLAEALAAELLPTITGGARISTVTAGALAAALLPTATGGALVAATLAEAIAAALTPAVTGGALVNALLASADALALVPMITGGATVETILGEAVAAALIPIVTGGATVSPELATAIAEALIPVITGEGAEGAIVYAAIAEAVAAILAPAISGGMGAVVSAVAAQAFAEALAPRILTLFIRLTLDSRGRDLTLDGRSHALTLDGRSVSLTLHTR